MCLLVIVVVVAYDALAVQHFSDRISVPTARYFEGANSVPLTQKPWDIFIVNDLIQTPGNLYPLIC